MEASEPKLYSSAQRYLALLYGIVCHLLFSVAIGLMAWSLYHGMTSGLGEARGAERLLYNGILLLQFPLLHSWLMTRRGRRLMSRPVPMGIGQELSSTVFSSFSSLQLILVFLAWSPSHTVWWAAEGGLRVLISLAAIGAWLFLMKAMSEAQLSLQTGFLGWHSVWRGARPKYRSFPQRGLYRRMRQPIYAAFALILWSSPVWTIDQLVLATVWTGYCIGGAMLKERRYCQYYGSAFKFYQQCVPFWLRGKRAGGDVPDLKGVSNWEYDVVIVGSGPVGLLLANELGDKDLRVLVVERRHTHQRASMAIGITPPSLHILKKHGLDRTFCNEGVLIRSAHLWEKKVFLGQIDLTAIQKPYSFILSLPQARTVALLEERLAQRKNVEIRMGWEGEFLSQDSQSAMLKLTELSSGRVEEIRTGYLVACDGQRSRIREQLKMAVSGKTYSPFFMMGDFEDTSALRSDAHLFFGPEGSVESFPLPDAKRRWIIQTDGACEPSAEHLVTTVRERCGIALHAQACDFTSGFRPHYQLVDSYSAGRVSFCGDAAHVMSPIGGQGMNTGFADAVHLAAALRESIDSPELYPALMATYDRARRRAFSIAARRAACAMTVGAARGGVASRIRRLLVCGILLRPSTRRWLADTFSMLTISPIYSGIQRVAREPVGTGES